MFAEAECRRIRQEQLEIEAQSAREEARMAQVRAELASARSARSSRSSRGKRQRRLEEVEPETVEPEPTSPDLDQAMSEILEREGILQTPLNTQTLEQHELTTGDTAQVKRELFHRSLSEAPGTRNASPASSSKRRADAPSPDDRPVGRTKVHHDDVPVPGHSRY